MKNVNFKSLRVKNFLSIGDEPIELEFNQAPSGQINIITGENRDKKDSSNGVGKSSLIEAFAFALYGKSFRGVKLDRLVNNTTKKSPEVEVVFTINSDPKEYKLVRKLKPSKVYLYQDGKDITLDTIGNNTNYIEDLIGYSLEGFTYYKLMAMSNNTSFMQLRPADKRKIIEDLLDFKNIGNALKKVLAEYAVLKKDQITSHTTVTENKKMLDALNKQLQETERLILEQNNTAQIDNNYKQEELDKNKELLNELNKKIKEDTKKLNKIVDAISSETEKQTEKEGDRYKEIAVRDMYENQLQRTDNTDICVTCKRPLESHDKKEVDKSNEFIKAIVKRHNDNISDLDHEIKAIQEKLVKYKNARKILDISINKQNLEKNKLENDIEKLNEELSKQKKDNSLIDIKKNQEKLVHDKNKYIEDNTRILEDINKNLSILDKCKFILGDDGIKTVMVERVIHFFNDLVYNYLVKMESPYFIEFDEYFNERVYNSANHELDYLNLSGAERKYIDLSIMFAFSDLKSIQQGVFLNVLFFDELLDSSVDSNGLDKIIAVLKERKENVFIISHRKEYKMLADDTGGELIYLIMENKTTTRAK